MKKTQALPGNLSFAYGFKDKLKNCSNLSINLIDGKILLTDSNGNRVLPDFATLIISRDRNSESKKTKIISKIPIDVNKLNMNMIEGALTQYDYLSSIDTNTKKIGGDKISATGIIELTIKKVDGSTLEYSYKFQQPRVICSINHAADKPENQGWMYYIRQIRKSISNKTIGILVDSDLDNIESYNRRELAICDSFFLPKNVKLIYASSDIQWHFINQIIVQADKVANSFLKEFASGKIKVTHQIENFNMKDEFGIEPNSGIVKGIVIPEGTTVELYGKRNTN